MHVPYTQVLQPTLLVFSPPFGRSFSQSHGAKSDRDEDDTAAERFRSVAQFLGKGEGEMSLDQDEIVSLIEKNQTGKERAAHCAIRC